MIEEEKITRGKKATKNQNSVANDDNDDNTVSVESNTLEPEKPAWMKSASESSTNSTTISTTTSPGTTLPTTSSAGTTIDSANLESVNLEPERSPEDILIAGLESMLVRQREREEEFKSMHKLEVSKSFWGRRKQVVDPHHEEMLQGFKDEKARIKKNIRDVRMKK